MQIVVCIKQVPDTADIKWTKNNTIQREGIESVINPFDCYAIETALKVKDIISETNITAITMGPVQSEEIIKKSITLGVDEGFVLSDKKFAGADTVATGKTLACAISKYAKNSDLILCGQFATDGDTAQTGPTLASNLNYPVITYVKEILSVENGYVTVKKEVEDGIETLSAKMPAVLCIKKCDYEPRRPLINGFITAHNKKIPVYTLEDLEINSEIVGIKGSPTCVCKAFRPEQKKYCKFIDSKNINDIINELSEAING